MDITHVFVRRSWLVIVTFVLLATTVACAQVPQGVPGFVVLITPLVPGDGICTGTAIAPRLVLTAAHCVPTAKRIVTATGQETYVVDARVAANADVAILETKHVMWMSAYAELGNPELGVMAEIVGYCPWQVSYVARHAFYNGIETLTRKDGTEIDFGLWRMVGSKACGGDSGAAILSGGKVVGVLSLVDSELFWVALGSTVYAVPVEDARELLGDKVATGE